MKKHLQRAIVKWSLKNLKFLRDEDFCAESSMFRVGNALSNKYCFHLLLKSNFDGQILKSIHLCLVNCFPDVTGNTKIVYRLGYMKNSKEIWISSFSGEDGLAHVPNDLVNYFIVTTENTLNVICEIIIWEPPVQSIEVTSTKAGLSDDLKDLLADHSSTDLELKVGDETLKAHQSILSARSTVFRDLFRDKCSHLDIETSGLNANAMRAMLRYIYSGDLQYTLRDSISFELYQCSLKYNVKDLKYLLEPDEVHIRSIVPVEEFEYIWEVVNFKLLDIPMNTCLLSPEFYTLHSSKDHWQIQLYPNGTPNNTDKVAISVQMKEKEGYSIKHVLSLLDKDNAPSISAKGHISKNNNDPLFLFSDRKKILKESLQSRGSLKIQLCIQIQSLQVTGSLAKVTVSGHTDFGNQNSLDNLCDDMKCLLLCGYNSDLNISSNGTKFKVHRNVLSARLPIFASIFQSCSDLELKNVPPNVLEMVLFYLYSGKLDSVDIDTILDFYESGNYFDLSTLKEECSKFLRCIRILLNIVACVDLGYRFIQTQLFTNNKVGKK